jgi:uncharacterized protein (DUF305 family)
MLAAGLALMPALSGQTRAEGTPVSDPCAMLPPATPGMMGGPMMGTPGAGMEPGMMHATPGMPVIDFDLMFIDMMIEHHEGAIAMAQVALVRAEHEEVRQVAQAIIGAQSREIEQLRAWRDQWYPNAPHMPEEQMMGMMMEMMMGMPGMGADQQMMEMLQHGMDAPGQMRALCTVQGPFDLAFINGMIFHHQSAIAMAQVALQQAQHPELRAFAQGVIDAQQAEIEQMTRWRAEWYGATPAAG